MQVYVLLVINMSLLLTGQILWKFGVSELKSVTLCSILCSFFSPYIIGGLILYGIATVIWLIILSKEQFSIVYSLQSLTYILGVFAGCFIFHERIPFTRWIGAATMFVGALLITKK